MIKKLLKTRQHRSKQTAKELLSIEIVEIAEIAEKLFTRLDEKINTLKSFETLIDEKIVALENVLSKVEKINLSAYSLDSRNREIVALAKKGLKVREIADFFNIPKGEVELILNLGK